MIKGKNLILFLIFILLINCSFDNKTGIWGGEEEEKRKISELEKEQKQIIDVYKVYSSESNSLKEIILNRDIILVEPKKIHHGKCLV